MGVSFSCLCVKLSNALVFPDPDDPIINILDGHFLSSSLLFLFVIACKLTFLYVIKMKYRPYKNEFWNEKDAKELFQILPFCNVLIEKPKLKHLSNIELLQELTFYDELSVVEISKAFKRYARSYKIEIIDTKDPLVQLEASKSSIEEDLLNEMKGFKYQITVTVLLCKDKENGDIEYPVYFNSAIQ